METKPKETLIRPVKCHFCNQQMFYAGDERHEPEVTVTLYTGGDYVNGDTTFYAHIRCWNSKMGPETCDVSHISKAAKDYQSTI